MKRIAIAGVAGGIVVFIWSFVSWMFIPWHQMEQLPGESAIAEAMRKAEVPSGAYFLPYVDQKALTAMTPEDRKAAEDAWEEAHRRGPVALIMYESEGSSPMPIMGFITGIILDVVIAAIAAFLLSMAAPAIPSFVGRVLFIVLLGFYTAVGSNLMDWNWMNYPLGFSLQLAGDSIVTSLLLGLVLAVIIKPESSVVDESDYEVPV